MREMVADLFVTLDGFALGTESEAYFGLGGPGLDAWVARELAVPQVIVMGRRTFELLAPVTAGATDPGSVRMTELPKVVLSETITDPAWANTTVRPRATCASVEALKAEPGDLLRCMGSVSLVQSLLRFGVLDRLRLVVFPQVLAVTGREPVFAGLPDLHLDLARTEVLDDRLVVLEYDLRH